MVLPGLSNVQSPSFPAMQAGYLPRSVVTTHRPGLEGVQILLPENCANLCFGGKKRNTLFMTASQSL